MSSSENINTNNTNINNPLQKVVFISKVLLFSPKSYESLSAICQLASVTSSWDDTCFEQGLIGNVWSDERHFRDSILQNVAFRYSMVPENQPVGSPSILKHKLKYRLLRIILQNCCATKEAIHHTQRLRHCLFEYFLGTRDDNDRRVEVQDKLQYFFDHRDCLFHYRSSPGVPLRFVLPAVMDSNLEQLNSSSNRTSLERRLNLPAFYQSPATKPEIGVIITGQRNNRMLKYSHYPNEEDPFTWDFFIAPTSNPVDEVEFEAPFELESSNSSACSPNTGKYFVNMKRVTAEDSVTTIDGFQTTKYRDKIIISIYDVESGSLRTKGNKEKEQQLRAMDLIRDLTQNRPRYSLCILPDDDQEKFVHNTNICFIPSSSSSSSQNDRYAVFGANSSLFFIDVESMEVLSKIDDAINNNNYHNNTTVQKDVDTDSAADDDAENRIFHSIAVSSCGKYLAIKTLQKIHILEFETTAEDTPPIISKTNRRAPIVHHYHSSGSSNNNSIASTPCLERLRFFKPERNNNNNNQHLLITVLMNNSQDFVVYSVETGAQCGPIVSSGHYSRISAFAISPSGLILATGARDKRIHLFDWKFDEKESCFSWSKRIENENEDEENHRENSAADENDDDFPRSAAAHHYSSVAVLTGHMSLISHLEFATNKVLLSASQDKTIRYWNISESNLEDSFQKEITHQYAVGEAFLRQPQRDIMITTVSDNFHPVEFYSVTRNGLRIKEEEEYDVPFTKFEYPVIRVEEGEIDDVDEVGRCCGKLRVYEVEDLSGNVEKIMF